MEKPISINVTKSDKSSQAKRYKQFNALLDEINKLKLELAVLQEQMSSGQVFFNAKIKPLQDKRLALLAEDVRALHSLYPHKVFNNRDREKIAFLIVSHCENLFRAQYDFEGLTQIYNQYAEYTLEEQEAQRRQAKADLAEELNEDFGLDLEFDEDDDFEQIIEKAQADAERKRQAERETKGPKTEKQQVKEERERRRQRDIHKVRKNIYNELVKLLHPDLEMDEAKKVEKTERIKSVNEAYERKDLFALLNLQAEYLNKQGDDLTLMPDKEFKNYLQVLKTQEQELLHQLNSVGIHQGFDAYIRQHLCHPNPITLKMLRKKAVLEEKEALKAYQHNLNLSKSATTLKEALQYFEVEED
jgi:hypothetical protein